MTYRCRRRLAESCCHYLLGVLLCAPDSVCCVSSVRAWLHGFGVCRNCRSCDDGSAGARSRCGLSARGVWFFLPVFAGRGVDIHFPANGIFFPHPDRADRWCAPPVAIRHWRQMRLFVGSYVAIRVVAVAAIAGRVAGMKRHRSCQACPIGRSRVASILPPGSGTEWEVIPVSETGGSGKRLTETELYHVLHAPVLYEHGILGI